MLYEVITDRGPQQFLAGASPLLTDLYELNMVQAYLDAGMTETAVFEFFVRRLPASRGFLLAAGLEQAVEFLMSGYKDYTSVDSVFSMPKRTVEEKFTPKPAVQAAE